MATKKSTKKPTLKTTRKFDGKSYRKKASHRLKSLATKSAKSARNAGKKARVTKSKSHGYTVYTRG